MNCDEITLGKQFVQSHHSDPKLRRTSRLHVGVVCDQTHTKCAQSLRNQNANTSKSHYSNDFVSDFHARVLAAFPFAVMQGLIGWSNVTGAGQEQPDG